MKHNAYIRGLDNQRTTVVAAVYIPDLAYDQVKVMDDRQVTIDGQTIEFPNYKGHFCAEYIAAIMAVNAVEVGDEITLYTSNKTCIQMYAKESQKVPFDFFVNLLNATVKERNVKINWIHVLKDSDQITRYVNQIAKRVMPYD